MADEKQAGLLRDILDSAEAIRDPAGVSREAFSNNREKQDAVLRRFEIIGEAASRLLPETQMMFSIVSFRSMRGMRNIIAHDYGEVDLGQVWKTATVDIPDLISALAAHFS